ncbi:Methyl-CpG-binding domain-containing protein 10 [Platanthera guangdongensis]|uniref:Methyl-CpG-binding domain-containing protein 10 n=1 Tax=Platanthera guangdongensis TaxID=2320717 RepID=A0ABR2MZB9_9ASPA
MHMHALEAPEFISKKAGTPKRNEIAFISPTGEEIRYKKQLDRYLRSHPGGPSSSQFDWGHGDTLRRSARLSEKAKEMETSEEEPSKKQGTHLSSKKGTKKKKEGRDSDAEDYSPEAKRPKKREKHSTPKKGIIPKAKSVDAGIRGNEAEKYKLDTEAPESDSSAKVDMKDECKHKNVRVIDEVEDNAPVSVKIVAEGVEEAAAKLYSNDGNKHNKNDIDADIEDKAWESEKIITQALEILEDSDVKNLAKLDSNDDLDAEMNDGKLEAEQIATQALECTEDSDAKSVDKEPLEEDLHKAEEDEDKALLHKNHKGEQVSPSKAIPNAKFRDLKTPEKAAAIV